MTRPRQISCNFQLPVSIMQTELLQQPAGLVITFMPYFRSRPSYSKQIYYLLCLVLVVVISLFSLWGPGGYLELKRSQRQLEIQRIRVEALRSSNAEQSRRIEALRSDKDALERYARSKNYAKKGEIVQQLPDQAPTTRK